MNRKLLVMSFVHCFAAICLTNCSTNDECAAETEVIVTKILDTSNLVEVDGFYSSNIETKSLCSEDTLTYDSLEVFVSNWVDIKFGAYEEMSRTFYFLDEYPAESYVLYIDEMISFANRMGGFSDTVLISSDKFIFTNRCWEHAVSIYEMEPMGWNKKFHRIYCIQTFKRR